MDISLSEVITKKYNKSGEFIANSLRKEYICIYQVSGDMSNSYFINKDSAYLLMEAIHESLTAPFFNSRKVEREDYHDLDNRLERLILKDGRIFEISQHRILW